MYQSYLRGIEREVMVKHLIYLSAALLVCLLMAAAPSAEAASEVYTNTGTLASISLDYETVVVEVPAANCPTSASANSSTSKPSMSSETGRMRS